MRSASPGPLVRYVLCGQVGAETYGAARWRWRCPAMAVSTSTSTTSSGCTRRIGVARWFSGLGPRPCMKRMAEAAGQLGGSLGILGSTPFSVMSA